MWWGGGCLKWLPENKVGIPVRLRKLVVPLGLAALTICASGRVFSYQIPYSEHANYCPIFHDDDSEIVFVLPIGEVEFYLCALDREGSSVRVITRLSSSPMRGRLLVGPDDSLLYLSREGNIQLIEKLEKDGERSVFHADADIKDLVVGTSRVVVATRFMAGFSDAATFEFYDFSGNKMAEDYSPEMPYAFPEWFLADGRLVYSALAGRTRCYYAVDMQSGVRSPWELPLSKEAGWHCFSRDGVSFVYAHPDTGGLQFVDGTNGGREIYPGNAAFDIHQPSLSSDGSEVVFAKLDSYRLLDSLVVVDTSGSEVETYTRDFLEQQIGAEITRFTPLPDPERWMPFMAIEPVVCRHAEINGKIKLLRRESSPPPDGRWYLLLILGCIGSLMAVLIRGFRR